MATRQYHSEPKKKDLESLSLSELMERFVNEIFTYRTNLSTALKQETEQITDEYMQRTKQLREELGRREQLYLERHNEFIGREID
jgi:hypothetical protein